MINFGAVWSAQEWSAPVGIGMFRHGNGRVW